jgi:hypothetical protein
MRYLPAFRAQVAFCVMQFAQLLLYMLEEDLRQEICSAALALLHLDSVDYGTAHQEEPLIPAINQLKCSCGTNVHAGTAAYALRESMNIIL